MLSNGVYWSPLKKHCKMELEMKETNRNKRATPVIIVTFYSVLCMKRNEATNRNKRATPVIIITFYEAKRARYTYE